LFFDSDEIATHLSRQTVEHVLLQGGYVKKILLEISSCFGKKLWIENLITKKEDRDELRLALITLKKRLLEKNDLRGLMPIKLIK
jgi:hypothetical protein